MGEEKGWVEWEVMAGAEADAFLERDAMGDGAEVDSGIGGKSLEWLMVVGLGELLLAHICSVGVAPGKTTPKPPTLLLRPKLALTPPPISLSLVLTPFLLEFNSAFLLTGKGSSEFKTASSSLRFGVNSSLLRLTGVGRILLLGVTETASGEVIEACFKAGKSDTSSL